jgi:hypothetical protein
MPWKEVDEARYDEMLGVLPPALWLAKGFLVGEPYDHRLCTITGVYGRPTRRSSSTKGATTKARTSRWPSSAPSTPPH